MKRVILKTTYKPPVVNFSSKKVVPSRVLPNQALTIKEILEKHIKGLPVDVKNYEGWYSEQNTFDLERIARSDFGDKFAMQELMRRRAEQLKTELDEQNDKAQAEEEASQTKSDTAQASKPSEKTGIDPLDNTMPVDTKQKIK